MFVAALTPHVGILRENVFVIIPIVIMGLSALAALKKAWFDAGTGIVAAVVFLLGAGIWSDLPHTDYTRHFSAIFAFTLFHVVLVIGPWARYVSKLGPIIRYRRHLAVQAFLWALIHGNLTFHFWYGDQISGIAQTVFVMFGVLGLYVMAVLAITSWNFFQTRIANSWWNWIHPASLVLLFALLILSYRDATFEVAAWQQWILGLFVFFWLLVAPGAVPRVFVQTVRGWKQLHMLAYVAYVSAWVHAWGSSVVVENVAVQVTLLIGAGVVVISHTVGWLWVFKVYWQKHKSV